MSFSAVVDWAPSERKSKIKFADPSTIPAFLGVAKGASLLVGRVVSGDDNLVVDAADKAKSEHARRAKHLVALVVVFLADGDVAAGALADVARDGQAVPLALQPPKSLARHSLVVRDAAGKALTCSALCACEDGLVFAPLVEGPGRAGPLAARHKRGICLAHLACLEHPVSIQQPLIQQPHHVVLGRGLLAHEAQQRPEVGLAPLGKVVIDRPFQARLAQHGLVVATAGKLDDSVLRHAQHAVGRRSRRRSTRPGSGHGRSTSSSRTTKPHSRVGDNKLSTTKTDA